MKEARLCDYAIFVAIQLVFSILPFLIAKIADAGESLHAT
jgi:hypothetical protein